MLYHPLFRRMLILCFMALIGFSVAKSIDSGSLLGGILSAVSLTAGVYFLLLLQKIKENSSE